MRKLLSGIKQLKIKIRKWNYDSEGGRSVLEL